MPGRRSVSVEPEDIAVASPRRRSARIAQTVHQDSPAPNKGEASALPAKRTRRSQSIQEKSVNEIEKDLKTTSFARRSIRTESPLTILNKVETEQAVTPKRITRRSRSVQENDEPVSEPEKLKPVPVKRSRRLQSKENTEDKLDESIDQQSTSTLDNSEDEGTKGPPRRRVTRSMSKSPTSIQKAKPVAAPPPVVKKHRLSLNEKGLADGKLNTLDIIAENEDELDKHEETPSTSPTISTDLLNNNAKDTLGEFNTSKRAVVLVDRKSVDRTSPVKNDSFTATQTTEEKEISTTESLDKNIHLVENGQENETNLGDVENKSVDVIVAEEKLEEILDTKTNEHAEEKLEPESVEETLTEEVQTKQQIEESKISPNKINKNFDEKTEQEIVAENLKKTTEMDTDENEVSLDKKTKLNETTEQLVNELEKICKDDKPANLDVTEEIEKLELSTTTEMDAEEHKNNSGVDDTKNIDNIEKETIEQADKSKINIEEVDGIESDNTKNIAEIQEDETDLFEKTNNLEENEELNKSTTSETKSATNISIVCDDQGTEAINESKDEDNNCESNISIVNSIENVSSTPVKENKLENSLKENQENQDDEQEQNLSLVNDDGKSYSPIINVIQNISVHLETTDGTIIDSTCSPAKNNTSINKSKGEDDLNQINSDNNEILNASQSSTNNKDLDKTPVKKTPIKNKEEGIIENQKLSSTESMKASKDKMLEDFIKSFTAEKKRKRDLNESSEQSFRTQKKKRKQFSKIEFSDESDEEEVSENRRQKKEKYRRMMDDSEEEDSENENRNEFLDDMASEGEESSTPSIGSNDIIDEGESVGSGSSEQEDSDDDYEHGSFIVDDDEGNEDLLSGSEYDLSDNSGTKPRTTPKKNRRIITISDSDSEEELDKMSMQPFGGSSPSIVSVNQISSVDSDMESVEKQNEKLSQLIEDCIKSDKSESGDSNIMEVVETEDRKEDKQTKTPLVEEIEDKIHSDEQDKIEEAKILETSVTEDINKSEIDIIEPIEEISQTEIQITKTPDDVETTEITETPVENLSESENVDPNQTAETPKTKEKDARYKEILDKYFKQFESDQKRKRRETLGELSEINKTPKDKKRKRRQSLGTEENKSTMDEIKLAFDKYADEDKQMRQIKTRDNIEVSEDVKQVTQNVFETEDIGEPVVGTPEVVRRKSLVSAEIGTPGKYVRSPVQADKCLSAKKAKEIKIIDEADMLQDFHDTLSDETEVKTPKDKKKRKSQVHEQNELVTEENEIFADTDEIMDASMLKDFNITINEETKIKTPKNKKKKKSKLLVETEVVAEGNDEAEMLKDFVDTISDETEVKTPKNKNKRKSLMDEKIQDNLELSATKVESPGKFVKSPVQPNSVDRNDSKSPKHKRFSFSEDSEMVECQNVSVSEPKSEKSKKKKSRLSLEANKSLDEESTNEFLNISKTSRKSLSLGDIETVAEKTPKNERSKLSLDADVKLNQEGEEIARKESPWKVDEIETASPSLKKPKSKLSFDAETDTNLSFKEENNLSSEKKKHKKKNQNSSLSENTEQKMSEEIIADEFNSSGEKRKRSSIQLSSISDNDNVFEETQISEESDKPKKKKQKKSTISDSENEKLERTKKSSSDEAQSVKINKSEKKKKYSKSTDRIDTHVERQKTNTEANKKPAYISSDILKFVVEKERAVPSKSEYDTVAEYKPKNHNIYKNLIKPSGSGSTETSNLCVSSIKIKKQKKKQKYNNSNKTELIKASLQGQANCFNFKEEFLHGSSKRMATGDLMKMQKKRGVK